VTTQCGASRKNGFTLVRNLEGKCLVVTDGVSFSSEEALENREASEAQKL
jgi:hypothetical protein